MLNYLKSKTVWLQIVNVAAMAVAMFGIDVPPELQSELAVGLAAIGAIAGVVIRHFTDQPIGDK